MERLFLGIAGRVACVAKDSGALLWSTKLKGSSGVTTVHHDGAQLFAYAGGHLFCLDPEDGAIRWKNTLKGFGYGACVIASTGDSGTVIANQAADAQMAAITAAAVNRTAAQSGSGS